MLPAFFCLTLVLAPSLAEARAGSSYGGSSSSMGSRGTRTFENNGAAPVTRSMNPSPSASSPLSGGAGMGAPAVAGGSFLQRHPFMSGIAGGFLGSMLFSGLGGGVGGIGHVFGGLLTFLIIGLLIFFVIRLFSGRGFSFAGAGGGMPPPAGAAAAPAAGRSRGQDPGGACRLTAARVHATVRRRGVAASRPAAPGDDARNAGYFSEG